MKTQRALCLEALVGLAPHEEELGKNGYTEVNNLHSRVLLNPIADGGLTLDSVLLTLSCCRLKQYRLLFQTVTVPSTFSEDQMRRAGMLWAGVGLNVTRGLVTSKLIKWEIVCWAVS